MRCPYCGKLDDKVLESRTMANGESIRRRRECLSCGYRFTSYEHIEEKPFMVIKKDGKRQPFDRTKLEKGIERGFGKYRNRYRKQSCYERKRSARDFHTRVGQFSVGNIAQNR